jgi:hypothetical protein
MDDLDTNVQSLSGERCRFFRETGQIDTGLAEDGVQRSQLVDRQPAEIKRGVRVLGALPTDQALQLDHDVQHLRDLLGLHDANLGVAGPLQELVELDSLRLAGDLQEGHVLRGAVPGVLPDEVLALLLQHLVEVGVVLPGPLAPLELVTELDHFGQGVVGLRGRRTLQIPRGCLLPVAFESQEVGFGFVIPSRPRTHGQRCPVQLLESHLSNMSEATSDPLFRKPGGRGLTEAGARKL